jgi:hypothetical protein
MPMRRAVGETRCGCSRRSRTARDGSRRGIRGVLELERRTPARRRRPNDDSIIVEAGSPGTPMRVQRGAVRLAGFFETLHTPLVAGRRSSGRRVRASPRRAGVGEPGACGVGFGRCGAGQAHRPSATGRPVARRGRRGEGRPTPRLNQPAPETSSCRVRQETRPSFVVRSERAGTTAFLDELRRAVWSVNGNLSLASVQTLGEMYERSMARTSMTLKLLAIDGLLALVLASWASTAS